LLAVVDDFERASKSLSEFADLNPVTEGINLIYNKLKNILIQKGLQEIEMNSDDFNTDFHEAVSNVPTEDENKKGKIIDVVQKGYTLNGKIIRFAKVVVAT